MTMLQPGQPVGSPALPSANQTNPAKRRPLRPLDRVEVSFVADFNRRYPGETLHFFCRVQVHVAVENAILEILVPAGLTLQTTNTLPGLGAENIQVRQVGDNRYLQWSFPSSVEAGSQFECEIITQVALATQDITLDSYALFTAQRAGQTERISDRESLDIAVSARGSYIRYLPALYVRDALMGRLLMLFESFWAPISQQITHIDKYFDPTVAPPEFLTWLSSWLDLALDENWPDDRRRELIRSARRLYAKRGTRVGLQEYLEIYTGGDVQIIEHKAQNARIGRPLILGQGMALGRENSPHTFAVVLRLPRAHVEAQGEAYWQSMVQKLIDKEKPAHTSYTLQIDYLQPEERATP